MWPASLLALQDWPGNLIELFCSSCSLLLGTGAVLAMQGMHATVYGANPNSTCQHVKQFICMHQAGCIIALTLIRQSCGLLFQFISC